MTKSTNPLVAGIATLYDLLVLVGNHLQSPLLLLVRLVWGLQLVEAGYGKLTNIQKPTEYFTSIGIPFPLENAYLVGCTECFGGLFLAIGLLSRLTAIPLIINFIVAYVTTEQTALHKLLSLDSDDFFAAAPYLFLFAAVMVLAFGPGAYSLDYWIARWRNLDRKSAGI
jgi:putative oxidoreductase